MPLNLDYFYGNEAEQYSFYRIPKVLFTDTRYKGVSVEAKVLYGLMLDRMGLSLRNGWLDSAGRVYIYFTLDDAMAQMNCGHNKAVKLFSDLSDIGLIERVKQGQGRPTLIFVKNFVLPQVSDPAPESTPPPNQPPETSPPSEAPPFSKTVQASEPVSDSTDTQPPAHSPAPLNIQTSDFGKSEPLQTPQISRSTPVKPAFPQNGEVLTSEKRKSGIPQTGSLDFLKSEANKTDKNYTEFSDTDPSFIPPAPTPQTSPPCAERSGRKLRKRMMEEMETYREIIQENIDYPALLREYPHDDNLLDGYIELMVEVCCTRREFTRINRSDLPTEVVKSHFLKLTHEDICCVMDCMDKNTAKITNLKAYMLTTLYNAPALSGQYFKSLASHDIAQGLI